MLYDAVIFVLHLHLFPHVYIIGKYGAIVVVFILFTATNEYEFLFSPALRSLLREDCQTDSLLLQT